MLAWTLTPLGRGPDEHRQHKVQMPGSGQEPSSLPGTQPGWVRERRSSRLRKPDGYRKPSNGGTVIRALVRARLFGIQLLTLEARVVVRPDDGDWTVLPPLVFSPRESLAGDPRSANRGPMPSHVSEPTLERAIALVEQSAGTLERSWRLR